MREAQARYGLSKKGRATSRRWRISPKGKVRERARVRRYYLRHGERKRARMRAYHEEHREQRLAAMRDYKARFGASQEIAFWIRQGRNAA